MNTTLKVVLVILSLAGITPLKASEEIANVQRQLTWLGFKPGTADGKWGRKSTNAFVKFYTSIGKEFDGILDETELIDLRNAVDKKRLQLPDSYSVLKSDPIYQFAEPELGLYKPRSFKDIFRALADVDADGEDKLFAVSALYNLGEGQKGAIPAYIGLFSKSSRNTWEKHQDAIVNPKDFCIHPRKVIPSDFNNDGRLDLFVACHGYDKAPFSGERSKILIQLEDGRFEIRDAMSQSGYYHGAAAADFNQDGYLDIIATMSMHRRPVRVFLNDGNGFFKPTSSYVPQRYTRSISVFTVETPDVNGDGIFDLFVAGHDWEGGPARYYINDGTNNFSRTRATTIPNIPGWGVILDAVATHTRGKSSVWVLRSSGGDGTFYKGTAIQEFEVGSGRSKLAFVRDFGHWQPRIFLLNGKNQPTVGSDNLYSGVAVEVQ